VSTVTKAAFARRAQKAESVSVSVIMVCSFEAGFIAASIPKEREAVASK
jgi:hypothetical protein